MKVRVRGRQHLALPRIATIIFALFLLLAAISAISWTEKAHSETSSALSISADVPNGLGPQSLGTITLHFSNTGSEDIPAPLLVLQGSNNALLTLDQSKNGQVLNTTSYPPGFTSTIQVIGGGSTPGVLKAGESISLAVYYCGQLKPWDVSQNQVNFTLSSFEVTNTDTIDWSYLMSCSITTSPSAIYGTNLIASSSL